MGLRGAPLVKTPGGWRISQIGTGSASRSPAETTRKAGRALARPAGRSWITAYCYAPGLSVSCLGGLTLPTTWTGRPPRGARCRGWTPRGPWPGWRSAGPHTLALPERRERLRHCRRSGHLRAGRAGPQRACAHGPAGGHLRCSADHGPAAHPQLLDHRAHRPRQVDARRPHPRADPHGRSAGDARTAAGLDGPRARAGDHDQGPGGARVLHRQGRADLPAAPDRHARARGLHLRGVPLAGGVRGGAAGRRRLPGGGGPDGRQHLPGGGVGARADPVPEQDRPARRRARAGGRRSERADRRAAGVDPADQRQDRRRASRRCSRS